MVRGVLKVKEFRESRERGDAAPQGERGALCGAGVPPALRAVGCGYTSHMAKQDEPNKVIYSMVGVGKVHGTKQVLKDIYLGYFYGAKIGVIGLNGSGKSTLLRIMAGVETEFIGEVAVLARATPSATSSRSRGSTRTRP